MKTGTKVRIRNPASHFDGLTGEVIEEQGHGRVGITLDNLPVDPRFPISFRIKELESATTFRGVPSDAKSRNL
jgi:hypothetical protein